MLSLTSREPGLCTERQNSTSNSQASHLPPMMRRKARTYSSRIWQKIIQVIVACGCLTLRACAESKPFTSLHSDRWVTESRAAHLFRAKSSLLKLHRSNEQLFLRGGSATDCGCGWQGTGPHADMPLMGEGEDEFHVRRLLIETWRDSALDVHV
jgi:hypothetical protein